MKGSETVVRVYGLNLAPVLNALFHFISGNVSLIIRARTALRLAKDMNSSRLAL